MSRRIPLTKGKEAIVDDDMFSFLMQWRWYCSTTNRAVRTEGDGKNQKTIFMHRVIMNTPPGMETDHQSLNTLDNRRENLRNCTRAQNSANKNRYSTNTSGFKGVSWSKNMKKWKAQITVNYKNTVLGHFDKIEDAARAYDEAAKERFGAFARGNEGANV